MTQRSKDRLRIVPRLNRRGRSTSGDGSHLMARKIKYCDKAISINLDTGLSVYFGGVLSPEESLWLDYSTTTTALNKVDKRIAP